MLDWSLVTDDREIVIVVPRAVQREIDRHKDEGDVQLIQADCLDLSAPRI
jgi:hypothetical protein